MEKATKQKRPEADRKDATIKRVFFRGLNIIHSADDELVIEIPVTTIERPHCHILSEDMRQWSQDVSIPESDYSCAYEAAADAFFAALEDAQVMSYLIEHQVR